MKEKPIDFFTWQERFSTEQACLSYLSEQRWPNGFQCPDCGHDHAHFLPNRYLYQCSGYHKQHSVTAGTLFHATKLPLRKWFWAIYLTMSDKGGVSVLRLSEHLDVSWPTAQRVLRKSRTAMGYRLSEMIELHDATASTVDDGKMNCMYDCCRLAQPICLLNSAEFALEASNIFIHHTRFNIQ